MKHFAGKNAVVTGAASGIGRGLAEELCAYGAHAIIADVAGDKAEEVAAKLRSEGKRATAVAVDVTDSDSVRALVERTRTDFGSLDFMFNNAGIAVMGEVRDTSIEELRRIIDLNVMGVISGSKAALSVMVKQGHGHIVNTASVTGLYTFPIFATYSASKFAVLAFSNALRIEARDLGVRVSAICPQNIMSNMKEKGIPARGAEDPDFFRKLPGAWMDANVAARKMLDGVARDKAIIIVPSHARVMWWLYRLQPGIVHAIGHSAAKLFRRHRAQHP